MKTMGIIFSNIYDRALSDLTNIRTVASLPFGGRYRIIDFVLSNFSNSGIYNIGIITKYNYRSLMDHLGSCADWDLNRKTEGVKILPPFAEGSMRVYQGKLEALYSAYHFINDSNHDYVVLCDSVVTCNIDFREAVEKHAASGADVTFVAKKGSKSDRRKYPLVVKANNRNRITQMKIEYAADENSYIGMGMFIMSRKYLLSVLDETSALGLVHLERDFLQKRFNAGELKASLYEFDGVMLYNLDVQSYYKNSMALLNKEIRDGLFIKNRPIYTKIRDEAPTYYADGSKIDNCLVADGCIMDGKAENSIFFRKVNVDEGARIKDSIIMQGTTVGKDAVLKYVILDKDVTVTPGTKLIGTPEHPVIIKKGEIV